MNEKVLVSITLPATSKTYEFWVPPTMELYDASSLVTNTLDAKESAMFNKGNEQHIFMLKSSGEILDVSQTIKELELKNGTKLVLV